MGLPPNVFWRMTVREWRAACKGYAQKVSGGRSAPDRMSRSDLDALMAEYPDDPEADERLKRYVAELHGKTHG